MAQRKKAVKVKRSGASPPPEAQPEPPETVRLRTFGPGLMLHSPCAVASFRFGECYTDALGGRWSTAGRRVRCGRIVMIDTGSPGLDYALAFESGAPPDEELAQALSTIEFRLDVRDDQLVVRDGYQAESWGDADYDRVLVPLTSGRYRVTGLQMPPVRHSQIRLRFYLTPDERGIRGQSWIDVDDRA